MSRKTQRVLLRLYYDAPLIGWIGLVLLSATALGEYHVSWNFIIAVVNFLTPQFPPFVGRLQESVSLYQLNGAFRNLAHIIAYAGLTHLALRALQKGQTRLKPRSVWTAVALSLLFLVAEEIIRARTPDRHAKWIDWARSGIGVVLVLGFSLVSYALRDWEKRTSEAIEEEDLQPNADCIVQ